MHVNVLLLWVVITIVSYFTFKRKALKSIFYSVVFVCTLWINVPCFLSTSAIEIDSSLTMLPFKLSKELGFLYTILANIFLCAILVLQERLFNSITFTHKEIKKIYDNFSDDAAKLYIIGKDLDFLYGDKYEKQTERIEHLGNNCTLLCEPTEDPNLLRLYKKVQQKGVKVGFYTENGNITSLKGQIKIDQTGNKSAIFTPKKGKKHLLLQIENQFLVSAILERLLDVYEKSYNPR